MYNPTKDKEILRKFQLINNETIIRFSMSNELAYAVWVDYFSIIHKYPNICDPDILSIAKEIDNWFAENEAKWSKMMTSKGFFLALADFTYDDSKALIEDIHQAFENNYKEATMEYYQLLGWTMATLFFIERAKVYYSETISDIKKSYGPGLCNLFKCFRFGACYDKMDILYHRIWKKVRKYHTGEDVTINHNNERTKDVTFKFNHTITDGKWIQERLRKSKLTYEINMYGYRDIK